MQRPASFPESYAVLGQATNENNAIRKSPAWTLRELLSLPGIGPKTASCVLALTLGRQRFVVDSHIHRITGMLGWRPPNESPEQARGHLECRIPDEHKYYHAWPRVRAMPGGGG